MKSIRTILAERLTQVMESMPWAVVPLLAMFSYTLWVDDRNENDNRDTNDGQAPFYLY